MGKKQRRLDTEIALQVAHEEREALLAENAVLRCALLRTVEASRELVRRESEVDAGTAEMLKMVSVAGMGKVVAVVQEVVNAAFSGKPLPPDPSFTLEVGS